MRRRQRRTSTEGWKETRRPPCPSSLHPSMAPEVARQLYWNIFRDRGLVTFEAVH